MMKMNQQINSQRKQLTQEDLIYLQEVERKMKGWIIEKQNLKEVAEKLENDLKDKNPAALNSCKDLYELEEQQAEIAEQVEITKLKIKLSKEEQ